MTTIHAPAKTATVTVYSKSLCVQCDATKRNLIKMEIDFDVVDIENDEEALAMVKSLGYSHAPVVITPDEHWSGFRPDKIKELKSTLVE